MRMSSSDAIRYELAVRLRVAYGTLDVAAKAMGIPYKTLYRNLTVEGKDRTATVALDLVLQITEHLQAHFGTGGLDDVWEASKRHRGLESADVREDAPPAAPM
jgi:hypothetical protein